VEYLKGKNGTVRGGVADGRPRLDLDAHACEAILALSGTTNGQLAVAGFRALERRTGWHTLTGRQHFFLDHDWMAELGEQLPVFRPPLDMRGERPAARSWPAQSRDLGPRSQDRSPLASRGRPQAG
jgi:nitrate reductase / nitrite oxidoreductase, alpha subunit